MIDARMTPVAERFSRSAHRYESEAVVQRAAAAQFDAWLSSQSTHAPRRIAEIGCGTGFLTRLLRTRFPDSLIQATDLAPMMIAHCRDAMRDDGRIEWRVCDGRDARFDPPPDWIVSAMCFQWFDPLLPVLRHHLSQARALGFSIMLDQSFSAWRAAHEKANLQPGLHRCPSYEQVLDACHALGGSRVRSERIRLYQEFADGCTFAQSLRAIGADMPRADHAPVNLKPVLRQLADGVTADYEIGFFYVER